MAGSFSVSMSSTSVMMAGSKRGEALAIEEIVRRYLQVMASQHATSITMKDMSGNTVGTMTWTPANSA